jgi:hypothetical protein
MLNTFEILVLVHFISDWFFQPGNWAVEKRKHFTPLLLHSVQYSLLFLPVFYLGGLNMLWTFWLFGTHLLIDDYRFVTWVNKKLGREKHADWFPVVQDQILHLLVLAVVAMWG